MFSTTITTQPTSSKIRGRSYDVLVCCGVSAVKWQANRFPAEDRAAIDRLLKNLALMTANRAILISTVDIYPSVEGVDESFDPHGQPNHAYGTNRLHVEDTIRQLFGSSHVVRLPGLFGPGLKKNVIYDLMRDNCLDAMHPRGSFQYYDIRRLWRDLQVVIGNELSVVNLAAAPIETRAIVDRYFSRQANSFASRSRPRLRRANSVCGILRSKGWLYLQCGTGACGLGQLDSTG
jgi:nucleoside-diphosphate-sugar epimerase